MAATSEFTEKTDTQTALIHLHRAVESLEYIHRNLVNCSQDIDDCLCENALARNGARMQIRLIREGYSLP